MPNASFLLGAALSAAFVLAFQEPQKPTPAAKETPKAAAAPSGEVPAPQDVPGRPARHPLEGVYQLHKRMADGVESNESRGYLAITHRYMLLCVAAAGTDVDLPLLRAAVHEWKPDQDLVRRVVRLSYYTDAGGGIHADAPGGVELRMIRAVQGGVRIAMDDSNWLEFTRVE